MQTFDSLSVTFLIESDGVTIVSRLVGIDCCLTLPNQLKENCAFVPNKSAVVSMLFEVLLWSSSPGYKKLCFFTGSKLV